MAHRKSGTPRRISRAGTTLIVALSLTGMVRAAYADCTPNGATAATGNSVVCSGVIPGFIAGSGVNELKINIGAGSTFQPVDTTFGTSATIVSAALKVNAGNTIVNNGLIENLGGTRATNYGVNLDGSGNTFTNNGQIHLSITSADIATTPGKSTVALRGVYTSSPSDTITYVDNKFINNGTVLVEHAGTGAALGTYPGEQIDGITFENHGTFAVNRTSTLAISVSGGNVFAAANGPAAAALGVAAAMSSDDDAEMEVENHAGGIIEATGDYTAAIYARAVELEIVNHGIIRNNSGAIAISAHGAAAEGDGELELENFGTVQGDILAVDGNALRYWAANAKGLTGLTLNNQAGIRNSEIENHGSIEGNIWLGSGTHVIENEGEIEGNIHVDQAGIGTAIGAKSFTLVNSGELEGDIQILDTAGATNTITLIGGGFTGNIAATGVGTNTLNLLGNGTLHDVEGITALNVGFAATGDDDDAGGGDDDDDDDDAPSTPGASRWTIAAGHEVEAGETTIGSGGVLIVDGELESEEINVLKAGTLVVNGKVEAEEELSVQAGGVLMGSGLIEAAEVDIRAGGTIDLRTTTLTIEGKLELKSGAIVKTTVFGPGGASADTASSNAGKLVVSETAEVSSGAKVVPVAAAGVVKTGDWYVVAHNSSGGEAFDALPQVQNSALINWQIQENANDDVVIGATVKSIASIPGITGASATTLNSLLSYTGNNSKLNDLIGRIQGLVTEAELRKAGAQLRPEVNGGQTRAAQTATDRVFSVVDNRLSQTQLSQLGNASGVSTGESGSKGVWAQVFGFQGDQDTRDGVDGYSANTAGLAFGADTTVGDGGTRVGAALSYADSSVEDDGVNTGNTSDVKSYQLSLYGSRLLANDWYINGSLGYGLHQYDTRRLVTVGGPTEVVTGNHDGQQYSVRAEVGKAIKLGSATLIPMAGLIYSHLKQDGYTESSNGGAALAIEGSTVDSTRSVLGARGRFNVGTDSSLELRAAWLHEFGDTNQDTTATFAAGGAAFTTSGVEQDREAFNIGASLSFASQDKTYKVMLSYDAEIKDQYIGHTALLQARYEF